MTAISSSSRPSIRPPQSAQLRSLARLLCSLATGSLILLILILPSFLHGTGMIERVMLAGRVSLLVACCSALGAVAVGAAIGLLAARCHGGYEVLSARCVEAQQALPPTLVALGAIWMLGGGLVYIVLFMILAHWAPYANSVRTEMSSPLKDEFADVAPTSAVQGFLMDRHSILRKTLASGAILLPLTVAEIILLESGLSFLGSGVQAQTPSWGSMLADGRDYLHTNWWISAAPGLAVMLTVVGLNLLSDELRYRLD